MAIKQLIVLMVVAILGRNEVHEQHRVREVDTGQGLDRGRKVDTGQGLDAGREVDTGQGQHRVREVDTGQGLDRGRKVDTGQGLDRGRKVDTGQGLNGGRKVDTGQGLDGGLKVDTGQGLDGGLKVDTGQGLDAGREVDTGQGQHRGRRVDTDQGLDGVLKWTLVRDWMGVLKWTLVRDWMGVLKWTLVRDWMGVLKWTLVRDWMGVLKWTLVRDWMEGAEITVTTISPNKGGTNGGTKITLEGTGFSSNAPNLGQGPLNDNKVWLKGVQTYTCDVSADRCTSTMIVCTTRAMTQGTYTVALSVDGITVSTDTICANTPCPYQTTAWNTPLFTSFSPRTGPPDTLLTFKGRLFTTRYGINTETATNGLEVQILRVYIGIDTCEMKDESDKLYGLELDSEEAYTGTLVCNASNVNIDNLGFAVIVDGPFGRSRVHPDLTWMTLNSKLAVFQMYAYVTSVSPLTGSVNGGTRITVSGRGFARGATSVSVGGLECEDVNVKSTSELTCLTPAKPSRDADYIYTGSRGVLCETWDLLKSFPDLAAVRSLSDSDTGYQNTTLEDSYYSSTSTDTFVVRISGFLVAPFTASFRMMLKGCGGALLFVRTPGGTMEELASSQDYNTMPECESYYNNREQDTQISELIQLQANQQYYFEIVHRHVDDNSFVQWGMFTEDTPPFSGISDADTGSLKMEEHELHFWKAVVEEKQELTIEKLLESDNAYTAEVQEIQIDNPKNGRTYRLKMFEAVTGAIDSMATANQVQKAIQSIPVFGEGDMVEVTVTSVPNSPIYSVTFDSKLGDLPSLEPVGVVDPLVVKVMEVTAGQSGRDTLAFTIGHSLTPLLVPGPPSVDDFKSKLKIGIGARCPNYLTKNPFASYSEDFENNPSLLSLGGEIVGNLEPYCGRYCLRNANFLYAKSASRAKPVGDNKLCLAYQGDVGGQLSIRCVEGHTEVTERVNIDFTKTTNKQWTYRCVQLTDLLSETSVCRRSSAGLVGVSFTSPVRNYYVDVVYLGSKFTTTDSPDLIWKQRTRPTMPAGKMIASVDVKSVPNEDPAIFTFEVSMTMYNCGHTVPLIKPYGAREISNNVFELTSKSGNNIRVIVKRSQAATQPIGGTVTVKAKGEEKEVPVSWDMDEYRVTELLESVDLDDMGSLEVVKEGQCADFTWTYKFVTKLGKQDLLEVVKTDPVGGEFEWEVKRKRTGRTEYDPCTPDQLRTPHHQPQVSVTVNSIPSACTGHCQFEWTDVATPTITTFTPLQGSVGDQLTITGSLFSVLAADNTVTVGDLDCQLDCGAPSSCSETQLVCSLGNGRPRSVSVTVSVAGTGTSTTTTASEFTYTSGIDSYTPLKGSIAGGTLLTFTGYGIPHNVSVILGSQRCLVVPPVTASQFTCRTPAQFAGDTSVSVTIGGRTFPSIPQFTYDSSTTVTPVVTASTLSGTEPSVLGGETVHFTGIGFEIGACTKLLLVKSGTRGQSVTSVPADLDVLSDLEATAVLPGAEPGIYSLQIDCQYGYALNEIILQIEYQFAITAVHPLRGSAYGGTRVTFTGEGFGDDPAKLTTTMGRHACEIDPVSFSSTQFVCQVGRTGKTYNITNNGFSARLGTGYNWYPRSGHYEVGDTIQWSFKAPQDELKMGVYELRNATGTVELLGGINSGDPAHTGSYRTDLSVAGVYYYWSRYLDQGIGDPATISFRAQYTVSERTESSEAISVTMGDDAVKRTALHIVDSGVTIDHGDCELSVPGCTASAPASTDLFYFSFLPCLGAVVTSISPTVATDKDDITIRTTLPGSQLCHTEITMGTKLCRVHSVMDDGVICRIDPGTDMVVGQSVPITVRTMELGYGVLAVPNPNFTLRSRVINASPEQGSAAGGTTLVITGTGLNGGTPMVGGAECEVLEESFTEVKCRTPRMSASTDSSGDTRRAVQFYHNDSPGGVLSPQLAFRYLLVVKLTSVSPREVFGLTTLYLGGYGFGTDIGKVRVTVGQDRCVIQSVKDNLITCQIACLSAELHLVEVNIDNVGAAQSDSRFRILGRPAVEAVSPSSGSVYGGVLITVTGNAFYEDATTVTVGGRDCRVSGAVSTCHLICELPPADSDGLQPVEVKLGSTLVTGSTIHFAYSEEETAVVIAVVPVEGSPGIEISIEGQFFDAESREVYVGGVVCVVQTESPELITCKLGDHAAGVTDVVVMVPGYGRSAPEGDASMFTYLLIVDAPLHPKAGPPSGGQHVTLTGAGFDPEATTVTFDSSECDVLLELSSSTKLVFSTPPGSGTVDVEVSQDTVTRVITDGYDYGRPVSDPVIFGITPKTGGTEGGTRVTFTGSNFGDDVGKVTVDIAGVACAVQSPIEATTVVCVTSASAGRRSGTAAMLINSKPVKMYTYAQEEFLFVDKYSSAFTWGGSSPPVAGDIVVVSPEMTLMIDVEEVSILTMLLIDGGTVLFDETKSNILLQVHNILIINNGTLQIGTEKKPYMSDVTILLHGHALGQELLPIYGSKVLAVRQGRLDLHGIPRSSWTGLQTTAVKGATHIDLIVPVNWRVGDLIVIATTGNKVSQRQTETRTIRDISKNAHTLTLDHPLEHEHLSFNVIHGGHNFYVYAEVGLLSHNVKVMGSNDQDVSAENVQACEEGFDAGEFATQTCFSRRFGAEISSEQFGAQILVHAADPDRDQVVVRISNTEVTYAGQAFRHGRHPIHFRLNGDMSKSYVRDSAIHQTFSRAINIHATNNLMVENNVVYDVMGAAFVLEDGRATGNTLQNNLAVFVKASSSLLSEDVTPAAFWITNPNNNIQRNTAVGGTHVGFSYTLPNRHDGTSQGMNGVHAGFYSNTAHSIGRCGLRVFQEYDPREKEARTGAQSVALFGGFTAYLCEKAVELVNIEAFCLDYLYSLHNEIAAVDIKMSTNRSTVFQDKAGIIGGLFVAYDSTMPLHPQWDAGDGSAAITTYGVIFPYGHGGKVDGVKFVNYHTLGSSAITFTDSADSVYTDSVYGGGYTYKVTKVMFLNTVQRVLFPRDHAGVIEDDGTLTDSDEAVKVVVCSPPFLSVCTKDFSSMDLFNYGNIEVCLCPVETRFYRLTITVVSPATDERKRLKATYLDGSSFSPAKHTPHRPAWALTLMESDAGIILEFEESKRGNNMSYSGMVSDFNQAPADKVNYLILCHDMKAKPDKFFYNGETERQESPSALTSSDKDGTWHFHEDTRRLCYIVSSLRDEPVKTSPTLYVDDRSVAVETYKCEYDGCVTPDRTNISPSCVPDSTHILKTWKQFCNDLPTATKCDEGADVEIETGIWVTMGTTSTARLNKLIIRGTLQARNEADVEIVIKATYIVIIGGQLIIGCDDDPFVGKSTLMLLGSRRTPAFTDHTYSGADVPIGAKVLASFGGLTLTGSGPNVPWTTLGSSASAGDTFVTLAVTVTDWKVNDEVLITATGYNPKEAEKRRIQSINNDGPTTVLELNSGLTYSHTVGAERFNGTSYSIAAEIGDLTRNIKIIGEDYDDLIKESFGARVVVATWEDMGTGDVWQGYARLRNTEFYHTGQEGWTASYDPRFSLAYKDTGPAGVPASPSYVKYCVFHDGFSTAVGVFGAPDLLIEYNIIYHTVGTSIQTQSANTMLFYNLLCLMLWRGTYGDRNDTKLMEYTGSVQSFTEIDLVMVGNHVSSSQRTCLNVFPHPCDSDVVPWRDNVVHTCLIGVALFPTNDGQPSGVECVRYTGITAYKNWDYGMFYVGAASVEFDGVTLLDNGVGIWGLVHSPSALSHQLVNKYLLVNNTLVVLRSKHFDCENDKIDETDNSYLLSRQVGRSFRIEGSGYAGVTTGSFSSSHNEGPVMPLLDSRSYNSIGGHTLIKNTTFANLNKCPKSEDRAISTSPNTDDLIHPTVVERVRVVPQHSSNKDHLLYFHRPRMEKVNPASCGDMECDGHRKVMVQDNDGSLLGQSGTVLSMAEWSYGEDLNRGSGDHNIPKPMLLNTSSGDKLDPRELAAERGIVRDPTCVMREAWQAHLCTRYVYMMVIIESMDADTETRRLSPIALLGETDTTPQVSYLDLINGPQDHGRCFGDSCQKRISTFAIVVATNLSYKMFFTSTPPQWLRLTMLLSEKRHKFKIAIYYFKANRIDVFAFGEYKAPTNSYYEGPELMYYLDTYTNKNKYIPTINDECGTNFYETNTKLLHLIVCGSGNIDIKVSQAVFVHVSLPNMPAKDLHLTNLLKNMAQFLGVAEGRVKVREAIMESVSVSRHTRSAGSTTYVVQIADEPCNTTACATESLTLEAVDLVSLANKIVNAFLLGQISDILNVTVNSVHIEEVLPSTTDPTWKTIVDSGNVTAVLKVLDRIQFDTAIIEDTEGNPFTQQPVLHFVDAHGDHASILGISAMPWEVTATLRAGAGNSTGCTPTLAGTTALNFVDGWANFTDLLISCAGVAYMIDFDITSPTGTNFTLASANLTILTRSVTAAIASVSSSKYTDEAFNVTVHLKDGATDAVIDDIAWKGHTWTANVTISGSYEFSGSLTGTENVTFDPITGLAVFDDLVLDTAGIFKLVVEVTSSPAEYSFTVEHEEIVEWVDLKTSLTENNTGSVKYDLDYSIYGTTEFAKAACNNMMQMNRAISLSNCTSSPGSVIVSFVLRGSNTTLDEFLIMLCQNISSTLSFSFNGTTATLDKYVMVGGSEPSNCFPQDAGEVTKDSTASMLGIILAVLVVLIILLVVGVGIYCCKANARSHRLKLTQVSQMLDEEIMEEPITEKPPGPPGTFLFDPDPTYTEDPPDQLFRQDTFMGFRDYFPEKQMPPVANTFRLRPKTPKKFSFQ